jgi:hypothetical protein
VQGKVGECSENKKREGKIVSTLSTKKGEKNKGVEGQGRRGRDRLTCRIT